MKTWAALEETKRRLDLAESLPLLSDLIDKVTMDRMIVWATTGQYRQLYDALLLVWRKSDPKSHKNLLHALTLSGIGAGFSSDKISEDMM